MNKEVLEKKVADILNISHEESGFAFSLFKEKLANFLSIGEAIKIENLGVFQLKEQLSHSDDDKSVEPSPTLVFAPESGQTIEGSLFINLEIVDKVKDETEFDENVFQIGIGKPLATQIKDEDLADANSNKSATEELENQINNLFENSEKLKEFDLWEDYLKSKETTSMINNNLGDESPKDTKDLISEEDDLLEKDFIELDENEIFEGLTEESDFMNDNELDTLTDDPKIEELEIEESIKDEYETLDENFTLEDEKLDMESEDKIDQIHDSLDNNIDESVLDDISLEFQKDDNNKDQIVDNSFDDEISEEAGSDDLIESLDQNIASIGDKISSESVIDEIDQEIEKNSIDEIEKIEESIEGENSEVPEIDDLNEAVDNDEDNIDEDKIADEKVDEEIINEIKSGVEKKKKKPILFLLIIAALLIGAIAIYSLFFQKSPEKYVDQPNEEVIAEGESQEITDNTSLDEGTELADPDEIKSGTESVENNNQAPAEASIDNNTTQIEDKEVATNIYSDGKNYFAQISSWKQERIAEKEVSKLVDKGFPAFIVKIFIPKFDGTWHRVRIGPYKTVKEAQQAKSKIN